MFHDATGTRGQGSKPAKHGSNCADRAKRRPDRPGLAEPVPDMALVENDGLRFRILPEVRDDYAANPSDLAAITDAFRSAFSGLWARLALADRWRLITYWRQDRDSLAIRARTPGDGPAPLIQVVARPDLAEIELTSFGAVISVPAALVAGQPGRLAWEVARAMAQVFRLVTREHWKLVLEKIDGPLATWEAAQGDGVSFEARELKLDELERDYLAHHDAQVATILARWGVGPPT